jgi:N-methylhydantoinase A
LRVAIDTGGTFTDCVYLAEGQLHVLKLFSTPEDPALAVLEALRRVGRDFGQDVENPGIEARHGTTVATNAMLERKGARVAFITTAGFEDTLAIGRQARASLYDWFAPAAQCLAPRELRFGVPERVTAEGAILRSPSEEELAALAVAVAESGAEAVAVSLLFSFANPETEQRIEAALQSLGLPISLSHRILPEFREYERASTTVVNAYLAPRMNRYLTHLAERVTEGNAGGRVHVMQSSGGIVSARLAAREPVRTVLSGPAGGVIGACRMARLAGFERIIGIDMGGTSTDVFLSADTAVGARLTRESIVAGVPIGIPMLDIHTVGAGGGSIARFDAGGMLRVGPESAGADPGPICFGRGTAATVTDANFALGRLDASSFLGGSVELDRSRAERLLHEQKGPLATVEEFASGILRVVETRMESAIRVISIERGHDPREFALAAFGGGGPLHACALARALRIPTVLVPAMPGALSAVGILLADTVRDYSRTIMLPGEEIDALESIFAKMEDQGRAEAAAEGFEGVAHRTVDIRYLRQGYELNLPYESRSPADSIAAFHRLHQQLYGFSHPQKAVEIVNLRLRLTAAGEPWKPLRREIVPGDGHAALDAERPIVFDGEAFQSRIYRREALVPGDVLHGPAMITEYTSATLLPPDCRASVDGYGNLIISIPQESPA